MVNDFELFDPRVAGTGYNDKQGGGGAAVAWAGVRDCAT